MHQYRLIILFLSAGIVLVSCGPKKMQDKIIKNIPSETPNIASDATQKIQEPSNPFADLSIDDIRNNREFFEIDSAFGDDSGAVSNTENNCRQMRSDEYEARLIDIAIPFGARLLDQYAESETNSNENVLCYVSTMPLAEVVHFYTEHMERLGWVCKCHIHGREQLLFFEKPNRCCGVAISSVTHQKYSVPITKIVLFNGLLR